MEAIRPSETSVGFQRSTRYYIPAYRTLQRKRCSSGRNHPGKFSISLLYAWVRVRVNFYLHHFTERKGAGTTATVSMQLSFILESWKLDTLGYSVMYEYLKQLSFVLHYLLILHYSFICVKIRKKQCPLCDLPTISVFWWSTRRRVWKSKEFLKLKPRQHHVRTTKIIPECSAQIIFTGTLVLIVYIYIWIIWL